MTITLTDILKGWKGNEDFKDLTWTGGFDDYLKIVKQTPKITRNAYQRMYDMILEHKSSEYVDTKKKVTRYHFFAFPSTTPPARSPSPSELGEDCR